jgi:DNA primase small subunit
MAEADIAADAEAQAEADVKIEEEKEKTKLEALFDDMDSDEEYGSSAPQIKSEEPSQIIPTLYCTPS